MMETTPYFIAQQPLKLTAIVCNYNDNYSALAYADNPFFAEPLQSEVSRRSCITTDLDKQCDKG